MNLDAVNPELESKINNIEKTLFWKIYRIFRRK